MSPNQEVLQLREKPTPQYLIDPFHPNYPLVLFSKAHQFEEMMLQGAYGPISSVERSKRIENSAGELLGKIKGQRERWHSMLDQDEHKASKQKDEALQNLRRRWESIEKERSEEEKRRTFLRESWESLSKRSLNVKKLTEDIRREWNAASKDRADEEQWIAEAVGMTTAFFEHDLRHDAKKPSPNFELWDNQLLFQTLEIASPGKYSFGELYSNNRDVNLDTGEGKTKCTGIVAAIKSLQNKQVYVIEQNYISAKNHALELAPFFEKYLRVEAGLLTDESEERQIIMDLEVDRQTGLISGGKKSGKNEKKSYRYLNGKMHELAGHSGRKSGWSAPIVYCDMQSFGGDAAKDRSLSTKPEERVQPDFQKAVALVQEADALMVDEAINPFTIQSVAQGNRAWDIIAEQFMFPDDTKKEKIPNTKEAAERRDVAVSFCYGLWSSLQTLMHSSDVYGEWVKSNDFLESGGKVVIGDKVLKLVKGALLPVFRDMFPDGGYGKFFDRNDHVVKAALEIAFGHQPDRGFISASDEPRLMDKYGVPLDRRQLPALSQVFLQMSNIWEKYGLSGAQMASGQEYNSALRKAKKAVELQIKVPDLILGRTLPSNLFREFGEIRASSGSLVPVSNTFADIYESETLVVSRHQPITPDMANLKSKGIKTICLDGGVAEVNFEEDDRLPYSIFKDIESIRERGMGGLIIMPDVKSALDLARQVDEFRQGKQFFPIEGGADEEQKQRILRKLELISGMDAPIKVITAKDELRERGALERATATFKAGDILITTQMAHRDLDIKLDQQVRDNGGMTTIVLDPPNERGLWQALQRSVRADIKGERKLYITRQTLNLPKNLHLIDNIPPVQLTMSKLDLHEQRVNEFTRLEKAAFSGDLKAQEELYRYYLGYLRSGESSLKDTILFSTVKEHANTNFQRGVMKFIQDNQPIWNAYVDYIAYRSYRQYSRRTIPAMSMPTYTYDQFVDAAREERKTTIPPSRVKKLISPKAPGQTVSTWDYSDSDNKRRELLTDLGLYGDMGFMAYRTMAENTMTSRLWSDMLDFADASYTSFGLEIANRQIPSIETYEAMWTNYLFGKLESFDLENYTKVKMGLLFR